MNITLSTPLLDSMNNFKFVDLFLRSTLLTVVFFMVMLSAMLIYSLMVSDIDERTYEMAIIYLVLTMLKIELNSINIPMINQFYILKFYNYYLTFV